MYLGAMKQIKILILRFFIYFAYYCTYIHNLVKFWLAYSIMYEYLPTSFEKSVGKQIDNYFMDIFFSQVFYITMIFPPIFKPLDSLEAKISQIKAIWKR